MSWFAELAGKAENILINLDEQTGAALRNQNFQTKQRKQDCVSNQSGNVKKKRPLPHSTRNVAGGKQVLPKSPVPSNHNDQRHQSQVIPTKSSKLKLPSRKSSPARTRVEVEGNEQDFSEPYGYKPRRYSLPTDLGNVMDSVWVHRLENLEVENAMLKNELNVTNREYKELLDRLNKTEEELMKTLKKLDSMESDNLKIISIKENLLQQIENMKSEMCNVTTIELGKLREEKQGLQTEIAVLRERNMDLAELIKHYEWKDKERDAVQNKTENDLRHAQSMINLLQSDLNKTQEECKRLENEWETYKLRVKSMLACKDKEIKALQQGVNLTEDTKILVEQIENLKQEREMLSKAVCQVRGECGDMKHYMEKMEARHGAAERVVVALRNALREERAARNKAEASCSSLAQDLKSVQMETGETIAKLRAALRDMECEMNRIQDSAPVSSLGTVESSALNVADFGVKSSYHSEDSERINYLTEKLMERQSQIEMLMADNNMLKIQLEKLESKRQGELQYLRTTDHSVVSFQDGNQRLRMTSKTTYSFTGKLSRWCGVLVRTHPLFRVFLVMYMVCLHIWVLTVLLTSTPDNSKPYNYNFRPQS